MRDITEVQGQTGIENKELQRAESVVEKQVKEARTKCRSIASLLTDAPNPNSKGVLMFKKRRQRAKKYTLTCFGKAPEDRGTESETGGDTEEEGGSSILSGSELDEEGFSGSFDPTWDSGYLDLLERRSSACPSTTPTTPTTNHSPALDISANQTPPFELSNSTVKLEAIPGLDTLAYQDSMLENGIANQQINSLPYCVPMSPPAMPSLTNGGSVAVSHASVILNPLPSQTPVQSQNTQQGNPNPGYDMNSSFSPNVLNRTARPFTPGPSTSSRPTVTSVMFRPPQPKPVSAPVQPVVAVSMTTLSPIHQPDSKRAVSSTSLYIPARSTNGNSSEISSTQSPPSSLSSATTISQPATNPPTFSPTALINVAHPYNPPPQQLTTPVTPNYPYAAIVLPVSQAHIEATQVPLQAPPTPHVNSYFNTDHSLPPSNPPQSPQVPTNDSLSTREQRISVPAARTGILNDARQRNTKKPMFAALQSKDVNPNPDLLSMVQNMDDCFSKGPSVETNSGAPIGEVGHELGPEEDWLRLGAEACNFLQAQRLSKPPPVAPKPQAPILPQVPQMPQLGGKGGQLFAKRQNRMDRYIVERSPSVAPFSPSQTRESSPTPSLPAAWKYSSNIRAPPPINYNPLLSPSCPLKAQKKHSPPNVDPMKAQKPAVPKPVDFMNHQPYQLNSSLFGYVGGGGGVPQNLPNPGTPGKVHKTAQVYEVKRFSTPPPISTGPALMVIAPRSATTLGEPMWRSDIASPPFQSNTAYQQPQWDPAPLSPPPPPAPNCPLPQLPSISSLPVVNSTPSTAQANRQFKSVPDLSPMNPVASSQSTPQIRVPRPRFSTSNLGLQPSVWRPGSTLY